MRFAPMKEILELAEERKIAYGAFVTVSYETALAAIEAGSELDCPVIFITGTDCCDLMGGFEGTVETVKRAAANATVPIALHLDHCRTYEECVQAIQAGYSSVMIDGSSLPFEENIALTKKVVDYAHTLGITVEGELGKLVGEEGDLIVKGPEKATTSGWAIRSAGSKRVCRENWCGLSCSQHRNPTWTLCGSSASEY